MEELFVRLWSEIIQRFPHTVEMDLRLTDARGKRRWLAIPHELQAAPRAELRAAGRAAPLVESESESEGEDESGPGDEGDRARELETERREVAELVASVTLRKAILIVLRGECHFMQTKPLAAAVRELFGEQWDERSIGTVASEMRGGPDALLANRSVDPGDGRGIGYGLKEWMTEGRERAD